MAFFKDLESTYQSECVVIGAKGSKGSIEGKSFDSTKLYVLRNLEGEGRHGVTAVEFPFGLDSNYQDLLRSRIELPARAKVTFRRVGKSLDRAREYEEIVAVEWLGSLQAEVVGHALSGKAFEAGRAKLAQQQNALFDVGGDSTLSSLVIGMHKGKGEYKGIAYDYCRLHRLVEIPQPTGIGYVVGLVDFGASIVYDDLIFSGLVLPAAVDLSISSGARSIDADVEVGKSLTYRGPLSLKAIRTASPTQSSAPAVEKPKA